MSTLQLEKTLEVTVSDPHLVSEMDRDLEVIRWSKAEVPSLTRPNVLAFLRRLADTPWDEFTLDRPDPWQEEYLRRTVGLDPHVVEILGANLTELKVISVGAVNIDVYIVGRDRRGAWAGLHTFVNGRLT